MSRAARLLAGPILVFVPLLSGCAGPLGDTGEGSASAALAAIAEDSFSNLLASDPVLALKHGLEVDELPDLSIDEARRQADFAASLLERLDAIDPAELDHEDWLSWSILRWQAENAIATPDHFWQFFQATPYSWSFNGVDQLFSDLPLADDEDLENYLSLAEQLPEIAAQLAANLAARREMGILIPRPELEAVIPLFEAQAADGDESPFWVDDERLSAIDAERTAAFRVALASLVAEKVRPAFEEIVQTLAGEYRKAAPEAIGLGQYPGGDEAYRAAVRYHTTLDLTPEEVHQRGLELVAEIETRMAELRRAFGFSGTAREFHQRLRSDPRFLAKTPEEVGERLMAPIARIEPLVDRFFARRPEAPYGVKRLDPELEGSMTFGYYLEPTPLEPVGHYFYNGSQLDQRPLVGAAALIYHELVPGHHFQVALQTENANLPAFRREFWSTAFGEGWAEYASELAGEMGLYDDPWDEYGRLAEDMFLTIRLVVDTGMNALGWSRARATEYMAARELETETQIATETLRYAVDMPGQALAYKIGSAKIRELRTRAESELGERFDIRGFHDAVIGSGGMPLAVLEEHIEWWIDRERARS